MLFILLASGVRESTILAPFHQLAKCRLRLYKQARSAHQATEESRKNFRKKVTMFGSATETTIGTNANASLNSAVQ